MQLARVQRSDGERDLPPARPTERSGHPGSHRHVLAGRDPCHRVRRRQRRQHRSWRPSIATTGSYGVANVESGNPRTSEGPDTRSVDAALNYHLVPNRLVGALTYAYNNYTDSKNTFPNPASNTSVTNRFGNVVGVRLMYAF
jgi:hypothetical protein